MFLIFALIALLVGAPGWALFWVVLYLIFD